MVGLSGQLQRSERMRTATGESLRLVLTLVAYRRPDDFLSCADEFCGRYGAELGRQVW
jgi:hypothetical protein